MNTPTSGGVATATATRFTARAHGIMVALHVARKRRSGQSASRFSGANIITSEKAELSMGVFHLGGLFDATNASKHLIDQSEDRILQINQSKNTLKHS